MTQDRETIEKAGIYVVGLLATLINNETPEPLPEGLTWKQVFDIAKMHSVDVMTFYAAKDLIAEQAPELYAEWNRSCQINLIKSMTQISERDKIIKALTEANIRVLPVKGCMMINVYPQIDWQQMCDLDILIDKENIENAASLMIDMGYTKGEESEKDISFTKEPYMNVELHFQLFEDRRKQRKQYYDHVWERAVEESSRPGCFWLKPDDEYIYQMAHFYKHYQEYMGSGIRTVLDIAMFRRRYKLNEAYVYQELETLGIADVSAYAESLAAHWFGEEGFAEVQYSFDNNKLSAEEQKMVLLVLCSGTYGNMDTVIMREVKLENDTLSARFNLTWKRAFLPMAVLKTGYPVLEKYPVLYPFCSVHRMFSKRKNGYAQLAKIFSK